MPREVVAEAVVQADIGGMTIAFTASIGPGDIDGTLDQWRRAINRQRAQYELVEALVDIQARLDALQSAPEREREAIRSRLDERARLVASWSAAHDASGKRAEFAMTQQHRQALADYDAGTEAERKKFAAESEKVRAELPLYEARAERARAIIAGKERHEVIEGIRLAAE